MQSSRVKHFSMAVIKGSEMFLNKGDQKSSVNILLQYAIRLSLFSVIFVHNIILYSKHVIRQNATFVIRT